jgi:glycine cleavage system regulatory protein
MSVSRENGEAKSSGERRNFGWADNIIAPPQEFDIRAAVDQEAWIAEKMRGTEVTRDNYAAQYDAALKAYRETRTKEPATEERMERLLDDIALFGAQASVRARQASGNRFVATFNAPDQPGLVAKAATALADAGGNIEGASMSVVAHQLLMAFLVSGPDPDQEGELQGVLEDALNDVGGVKPAVASTTVSDPDWPRPGSTFWHMTARLPGGAAELLTTVTNAVADERLPLLALSAWSETGSSGMDAPVQVVDLNLAIKPSSDDSAPAVLGRLDGKIRDGARKAQITFIPVAWPTRSPALGDAAGAEPGDLVLTVLGHAQPGFVRTVLEATRAAFRTRPVLRGATMAILESVTVLTVVLSRPGSDCDLSQLENDIQTRLSATDREEHHPTPVARLHDVAPVPAGSKYFRERPTHELRIQVKEQPGVIANVARMLADAGVNITWLASYVLEPRVGQAWFRCAVEMHLHFPANAPHERVDRELRTLEKMQGADVSLQPWSLSADRNGASG